MRSICCIIAVAHQTTCPCPYSHICEKMRLLGEWSPRPQSEGLKQHWRALTVRWVALWAPLPVQKITTDMEGYCLRQLRSGVGGGAQTWEAAQSSLEILCVCVCVCVLHVYAHMHTCSSVCVYTCVMSHMTKEGQSQCWVFLSRFPLHALERISCGIQSSPIPLV